MRRSIRADLALLGVAFVWGSTFPVVKGALADASPLLFLGARFALACLFVLPLWPALRPRPRKKELGAGLLLGALLAGSFALQTIGLQEIGAARSAFLTSLYVVFVPLLSIPVQRRLPPVNAWLGAALALLGLGLMTWDGLGWGWRAGDLMTIGCAAGFALHILGVGALTARFDYRRLFILQVAAATGLLLPAATLEPLRWTASPRLALALLLTAGLATALAFYVQNRVQRHISPTRTAIIFAMEPVFAAVCAAVLSGGRTGLSGRELAGAALILSGLITAGFRLSQGPHRGPGRRRTRSGAA